MRTLEDVNKADRKHWLAYNNAGRNQVVPKGFIKLPVDGIPRAIPVWPRFVSQGTIQGEPHRSIFIVGTNDGRYWIIFNTRELIQNIYGPYHSYIEAIGYTSSLFGKPDFMGGWSNAVGRMNFEILHQSAYFIKELNKSRLVKRAC